MLLELNARQLLPPASETPAERWLCLAVMGCLAIVSCALWRRTRQHAIERRRERLLREELEAYARFDAALAPGGDARQLAKRVCRMVAGKSAFRKTALMLRNPEGRLYVAGSAGMDDLTVGVLQAWGVSVVEQERRAAANLQPEGPDGGERDGAKSFLLDLSAERPASGDSSSPGRTTLHDCQGRAVVVPMQTLAGRLSGALAVSVDSDLPPWAPTLEEAVSPLETLAVKLARAVESAELTARLMRVEKLAGLGQLAGSMAHELNNPLTAVLGFGELIAETSVEPRVRDDAHTIVTEALRMREIIQNLVNFWRPVGQANEAVDLGQLLSEVVAACGEKLDQRGIALAVSAAGDLPPLRGNAQRLRVVLEHLLNNAAQAIQARPPAFDGRLSPDGEDEPPTIRVTVSQTARMLHLVVSDTGPGFRDPSRVFDPFYTTRPPDEGAGLGLSICYGIVREHGGEISAFNLYPRGAAVVVELPVREAVAGESEARTIIQERA